MSFDPNHDVAQILHSQAGKPVLIHLRSGATLAGKVGPLSSEHVVIEEIQQRDFYDAWVRLSEIAAIEARMRGA